jgi:hypothetical protein
MTINDRRGAEIGLYRFCLLNASLGIHFNTILGLSYLYRLNIQGIFDRFQIIF